MRSRGTDNRGVAIPRYSRTPLPAGDISCDIAAATDEESGNWTKTDEGLCRREAVDDQLFIEKPKKKRGICSVSIEFPTEREALRFERYLKSGSGRAFAKRHFNN